MPKSNLSDRKAALEEITRAFAESTVDAWLNGEISDDELLDEESGGDQPCKKNPAEAGLNR